MSDLDNLERLEALAAGLCQDADVRLEVSPAPEWAWDPIRRVMIVAGPDLENHGPEFCAGVLAHEVGHYYISRYPWFSVPFPSAPILRFLLNAIEDPRVNTWTKQRYPGAEPWMQVVAQLEMTQRDPEPKPKIIQFGYECAREEWLGWTPPPRGAVAPEVARALDRTRSARRRFAEMLPPANLDPDVYGPDLALRYRDEVWPRLSPRAYRLLPSPREQGVRLSVLESLELAEREILPVALELLDEDIDKLAEYLRDNPDAQKEADEALHQGDAKKLQQLANQSTQHQPSPGAADPRIELNVMSLGIMESLLDQLSRQGRQAPLTEGEEGESERRFMPHKGDDENEQQSQQQRRRSARRSQRRARSLTRELAEAAESRSAGGSAESIGQIPAATGYEAILNQVARQVQYLAQIIEEELKPVKRMADRRGYPSGYKLDLRRLMRYHADFKDYDKLWLRKTVPDRWSVAFSLLVDLSGSMEGAKVQAATAGSVLLAETLHRLTIPFLINGFHDVMIPFASIGEGLTPQVRRGLGEMPQRVTGGTELAPCLAKAAEEVMELGYDERLLVVITDGEPNNPDALHGVIRELLPMEPGLKLVAFGLGPGTDSVKNYFPECKVNVPVEQLGVEIGDLLRRMLRAGGRRRSESTY